MISYWLLQSPRGRQFEDLVSRHELAVSFATYGELLANGHRRRWGEHRMHYVRTRLRGFVVMPYNEAVVEVWARLHAKLAGHLHKGGTNDLWTAACAVSVKPCLPVVTNNLGEFQMIAAELSELVLVHPTL